MSGWEANVKHLLRGNKDVPVRSTYFFDCWVIAHLEMPSLYARSGGLPTDFDVAQTDCSAEQLSISPPRLPTPSPMY